MHVERCIPPSQRAPEPSAATAATDADGDVAEAPAPAILAIHDPQVVYVCNLHGTVSEQDLTKLFSACGTVDVVVLARDKFGNSKCWALVKFTTEVRVGLFVRAALVPVHQRCTPSLSFSLQEATLQALKLAGQDLNGLPLNIQPAKKTSVKLHMAQAVARAKAPTKLVPAALYVPPVLLLAEASLEQYVLRRRFADAAART